MIVDRIAPSRPVPDSKIGSPEPGPGPGDCRSGRYRPGTLAAMQRADGEVNVDRARGTVYCSQSTW
jgi:hypothetical protein